MPEIINDTPEVNLAQLAAEIRLDCAAIGEAGRCALGRAIAAGKRLLQAKECVGRTRNAATARCAATSPILKKPAAVSMRCGL